MLKTIELPHNRSVDIEYDEKVYDPSHTSVDVLYVADMFLKPNARVLDVGTGSGVIALSLKRLNPKADIHAVDIDPEAVKIAKKNARREKLKVEVWQGDLADERQNFDMVVANLPTYTEAEMAKLPIFGPRVSHFASKTDGLALYKKLVKQLDRALKQEGVFVLECQTKLQEKFETYMHKAGWLTMMKTDNCLAFIRS